MERAPRPAASTRGFATITITRCRALALDPERDPSDVGFRELSVGAWLARLQGSQYTREALGCVRKLSGLQSLLSVYLLAMWALTYFGRPFQ